MSGVVSGVVPLLSKHSTHKHILSLPLSFLACIQYYYACCMYMYMYGTDTVQGIASL